jgi:ubiquinone/menaquinone biosynthesis C-methylase UbiE
VAIRRSQVIKHFDRCSSSGFWSGLYASRTARNYDFHVRKERMLELLDPLPRRVLDLGCGPGAMAHELVQKPILETFLGIDLSPEMIREATQRYAGRPRVRFEVGDAEKLSTPDASFDTVLCIGVLEYMQRPDRAMKEIARVLAPSGYAIVTTTKLWHLDGAAAALTSPLRKMAKVFGAESDSYTSSLIGMQPRTLDTIAKAAGFVRTGFSHYHFRLLPRPFTGLFPGFCMKVNEALERFHHTSSTSLAFLASGYMGRYQKQGDRSS